MSEIERKAEFIANVLSKKQGGLPPELFFVEAYQIIMNGKESTVLSKAQLKKYKEQQDEAE